MKAIVDNAIHLIELYQANEIIMFSDVLSKQIPVSHAANAFNVFQDAMFRFEVVRLCVLWDPCQPTDLEKVSIPAVVQLVDESLVISALREETRRAHDTLQPAFLNPSSDPELRAMEIEMMNRVHKTLAEQHGIKAERRLQLAIRWTKNHMQLPRVQAMQNFRDKHIAHALSATRMEKKAAAAGSSVEKMRYRDARWLYRRTLAIVDNLYVSINGAGFDWHGSIEIAHRNASTLWGGCTFNIPQRGAYLMRFGWHSEDPFRRARPETPLSLRPRTKRFLQHGGRAHAR